MLASGIVQIWVSKVLPWDADDRNRCRCPPPCHIPERGSCTVTTAVVFNLPGAAGHINPTVGLVSELLARGERVIYYAGEDSRQQFEALGTTFRTYHPFFEYQHSAAAAKDLGTAAFMLIDHAECALAGLIEAMEKDRPDYILYDSCCLFGKYIAQRLGIPGICLVTTIVSSPILLVSDASLLMKVVKDLFSLAPRILEARRRLMDLLSSVGLKYRNIVHHSFDLFLNEGDLNIVFLGTASQPMPKLLNEHYKLVGASIPEGRDPPMELPAGWGSTHPLVYVSLGTVHNLKHDFYLKCLEAFADLPCKVIMSVGKNTDISSLGHIPANFLVRNRVPQLEVLKRAQVFVSHGGMNSINESTYFGVPLVMVPQQFEQAFNARRIYRQGAGLILKSTKVTPTTLRNAVQSILADARYKENADRLSRDIRSLGGQLRAADEILSFVHGQARPEIRKTA